MFRYPQKTKKDIFGLNLHSSVGFLVKNSFNGGKILASVLDSFVKLMVIMMLVVVVVLSPSLSL